MLKNIWESDNYILTQNGTEKKTHKHSCNNSEEILPKQIQERMKKL